MKIREGITFDDVLLEPAKSSVLPAEADVKTKITKKISLSIPLISAAMDTVTESKMAIAIAQAGGLGVIHRNLSIEEQANEVKKVKKFESGMVVDPVTISPNQSLKEALSLMETHNISGIPVTDSKTKELKGIITNRDVRFASNQDQKVSELMTKENLVTVSEGVTQKRAKAELHKHRIEKLIVVDKKYRCIGLITVKDMEKSQLHPTACKDDQGRLRVAAATSVGEKGLARAQALIDADVDVIVVDTAHGHSSQVADVVKKIKKISKSVQLIAGNVATKEATRSLIDAGADCIKVGIGPGSICTTRIVAGVGVPQLSAIVDCANEAHKSGVPIIADGGIKFSGDIAKALAAGADAVMIGSLFAGTDQAPGRIIKKHGDTYKYFRGMGSIGAMNKGSADRYFQSKQKDTSKYVAEGVEGYIKYKGTVDKIIYSLVGGLKSSMGYMGAKKVVDLRKKPKFLKITKAGFYESMVHNIDLVKK